MAHSEPFAFSSCITGVCARDYDRRPTSHRACTWHPDRPLCLRSKVDGRLQAGPVPARLKDLSRHGAQLEVARVRTDNRHLFFPQEDPPLVLHIVLHIELPTSAIESPTLSIPVHPFWLNRDFSEDIMPFRLGVKFLPDAGNKRLQQLQRLVRQAQKA